MASTIEEQISKIVENRRKNLPAVQAQYRSVSDMEKRVRTVISCVDDLLMYSKQIDEQQIADLSKLREELSCALGECAGIHGKLKNLESRFSRNTINIGVSGEARVGKSTTLQSFSGLSDTQIPTGTGLPVTAVRSEIFNSQETYALVAFRDTESFIREYIAPHVHNVNETGACNLVINSLAELSAAQLPDTLGDNVSSKASLSLRSLKEAQTSLGSYSPLLTGGEKREDIGSIRKYVAYPTNDEINAGGPVNRAYLAVKNVKVFSNFPSLSGEQIGLIDLPGLGEIGESVASIHTSGLENGVDQILLIMRPTEAEGFVNSGIAQNIDQLRSIQAGISRRGDLIVAAVNNDRNNAASAKTLRDDFESVINASQTADKIEIRDFVAVDSKSVKALFEYLLKKLVDALPTMDKDVFDYVISECVDANISRCKSILSDLSALANIILKTIPLEDSYLDQLADNLSRSLVFEYDELEEAKFSEANGTSPLRADLERQVEAIYSENQKRIDNGLFLASNKAWRIHAKGRTDYVNFLRSDAKRVKAEIVDSYRGVDVFYDDAIRQLKEQVLSVFYENTGNLYQFIGVDPGDATSDEDIQKLVGELDAITRDEGFTQCFRFISEVTFKFSQNVFYNIYSSLEELHNPDADQALGKRGLSGAERISIAEASLKSVASKGNAEIKKQILNYNDQFNRFLFTCMTFFNDFLYRKDDRRFERNIRALLKECRDYIILDEEVSIDRDIQRSIKRLKDALSGIGVSPSMREAKQPAKRGVPFKDNVPKSSQSLHRPKAASKPSAVKSPLIHGEDMIAGFSIPSSSKNESCKNDSTSSYSSSYDDQEW